MAADIVCFKRARRLDKVMQKHSNSGSTTEHNFDVHNMGMLNKLAQTSVNVAFTFLSSRNIRHISWTCHALRHLTNTQEVFACSSSVASESLPLESADRQIVGDLSSGRGGVNAAVLRALRSIVDAVDFLLFRRDTKVKTSTQQVILHLDVPTVCTNTEGQL